MGSDFSENITKISGTNNEGDNMRIFGVDVEAHAKQLDETDKLSADIIRELVLMQSRLKGHIEVLSEQCQGYKDDADHLVKMLEQMKATINE